MPLACYRDFKGIGVLFDNVCIYREFSSLVTRLCTIWHILLFGGTGPGLAGLVQFDRYWSKSGLE